MIIIKIELNTELDYYTQMILTDFFCDSNLKWTFYPQINFIFQFYPDANLIDKNSENQK